MDLDSHANPTVAYSETCVCNRTFTSPAAYRNHENSCPVGKQNLSNVLADLKKSRLQRSRGKAAAASESSKAEDEMQESGIPLSVEGNTVRTQTY